MANFGAFFRHSWLRVERGLFPVQHLIWVATKLSMCHRVISSSVWSRGVCWIRKGGAVNCSWTCHHLNFFVQLWQWSVFHRWQCWDQYQTATLCFRCCFLKTYHFWMWVIWARNKFFSSLLLLVCLCVIHIFVAFFIRMWTWLVSIISNIYFINMLFIHMGQRAKHGPYSLTRALVQSVKKAVKSTLRSRSNWTVPVHFVCLIHQIVESIKVLSFV